MAYSGNLLAPNYNPLVSQPQTGGAPGSLVTMPSGYDPRMYQTQQTTVPGPLLNTPSGYNPQVSQQQTAAPATPSTSFNWADFLGNNLGGMLNVGANAVLAKQGIDDTTAAGQKSQEALMALAEQARAGAEFKPYTVTAGPQGGFSATNTGLSMNMSPEQQAMMQQLQGRGMALMQGATADQSLQPRQEQLMGMFDAMRAPQREQEALALEQRMFNQGRSGVNTAQYGGTPEQFAFAKAQEQQRSADALTSRQQALTEQQQLFNAGQSMFTTGYKPQEQMLAMMQAATPYTELAARGQQQGVVTGAGLQQSGIEAGIQGEQRASNLREIYLQQIMEAMFAPQTGGTGGDPSSLVGGLFSNLFNKFKD